MFCMLRDKLINLSPGSVRDFRATGLFTGCDPRDKSLRLRDKGLDPQVEGLNPWDNVKLLLKSTV